MNALDPTVRVDGVSDFSGEHMAILNKIPERLDLSSIIWMASMTNDAGDDLATVAFEDGAIRLYHEDFDWDGLEVKVLRKSKGPGFKIVLLEEEISPPELFWLSTCIDAMEDGGFLLGVRYDDDRP